MMRQPTKADEPTAFISVPLISAAGTGPILSEEGRLRTTITTQAARIAELEKALADEREACAKICEPSVGTLLNAAGEMYAHERRTVIAVLAWLARAIRTRSTPTIPGDQK